MILCFCFSLLYIFPCCLFRNVYRSLVICIHAESDSPNYKNKTQNEINRVIIKTAFSTLFWLLLVFYVNELG